MISKCKQTLFFLSKFVLVLVIFTSCSKNPVTGKNEFVIWSEAKEIEIGEENYFFFQQSSGGEYIVDEEVSKYVNEVGQKLAKQSDRELPYEFVVLNNSVPNAWALPGGKIAIHRGLLTELHSEAELAAVLGHEIVHAAARHGAQGRTRVTAFSLGMLLLEELAQDHEYSDFIFLGSVYGGSLILLKYNRDQEREADHYGINYMTKAGYNPQAAVQLQETFLELSKKKKSNWFLGLLSTHPPTKERVANNKEHAATFQPIDYMGVERFEKAMASLTNTKEAYKHFDEGLKALKDGKAEEALSLSEKALEIEPREARFHSLKGKAERKLGLHYEALGSFENAISHNHEYYDFFLQRGLTYEKLGYRGEAQQDLERSVDILPTGEAHYTLGKIHDKEGNIEDALNHYRKASSSDSEFGEKAQKSLVRLDFPYNPQEYVNVNLLLDDQGYLKIEVKNKSKVNLRDLKVEIYVAPGFLEKANWSLNFYSLMSGGTSSLQTRIGPFNNIDNIRSIVQTKILSAQVKSSDSRIP